MEIWKQIAKAPEYEISYTGEVRRISDKRVYKHSKNRKGYYSVGVVVNGKRKALFIHQLLAEAFLPNPENKPNACFKNNNKDDLVVGNLIWMTVKEKAQDCKVNGFIDFKKNTMKACAASNAKTSKPITVIDEETGKTTNYPSTNACKKALGINSYQMQKLIEASV